MLIRRAFAAPAVVATAIAALPIAVFADTYSIAQFSIPAQPLSTALIDLSKQANIQILTSGHAVDGLHAPEVNGRFTLEAALEQLLKDSGFDYRFVDQSTLVLSPRGKATATMRRLAQVSAASGNIARDAEEGSKDSAPTAISMHERRIELEEIVVTGSHIRGVENRSSPVIRVERDFIEKSGYASTQQLIGALPQNFNSISDTTFDTINGGPGATYDGSGVNLRGLGGDSTLVLLNGRRLAAAGQGSFVDVSLIPLNAVERIDVLTDGASAIYGSDAVGGVVNIVTRRDFNGAETRFRYGAVTEGSHSERQASQMFGESWSSGQLLFSYDYYGRTDLDGADRTFIEPTEYIRSLKLIPEQDRHGAMMTMSQAITDRAELSGDLFYSRRKSAYGYDYGQVRAIDSDVQQTGGALGLSWGFARDWELRVSGLADRVESAQIWKDPSSGVVTTELGNESRLWSLDAAADGPIASLSGGEVRLAVGSQFRNERHIEAYAADVKLERDVAAVYAELVLPWVGAANSRVGIERFETTIAARYEDYSDFGSTLNPKIGISWQPVSGLNVRGTWGTSFKAPLLTQLTPANFQAVVYEGYFRDALGSPTTLQLVGSGEDLGPEESTSWTAGFDYEIPIGDGLKVSATYFDIDYRDRIRTPLPYDFFGVLLDPAYSALVDRSPDPQQVASWLAHENAQCYTQDGACAALPGPGEIDAVFDMRLRNLAAVQLSGIDVSLDYHWKGALGDLGVALTGAYLLNSREQLIRGAEVTDQINDVWRPVDLRLRGNLSYVRGSFSAMATLNYTDSYADNRDPFYAGEGSSGVSSWTTLDLSMRYELSSQLRFGSIEQASLTLATTNIFDRDPPFVASPYGIHFDGVNANPLGRFIALNLSLVW